MDSNLLCWFCFNSLINLIRMQKQNDRTRILSNKTTSNKTRYKKKIIYILYSLTRRDSAASTLSNVPRGRLFYHFSIPYHLCKYLIKVHQRKRTKVNSMFKWIIQCHAQKKTIITMKSSCAQMVILFLFDATILIYILRFFFSLFFS